MPKLITFLTLLLLLLTIPSFSFTRSQGMGNAAIAVVDDVWAGAINPAGLGKLNGSVLDTAYDNTVIYDDMRVIDKAIAFAFRSDIGTFAFSYVSTELIIFGIALSSYNGARVVFDGYTNMSYAVNLYFASYGIQVVPGLSMGASLKQYQNTFSLETSKTEDSGTGVDIGLQLSSEMLSKEFPRLLLGVKVSDLGGTNIRSANGSIFNVKEVIQYGIGFSPIEQIALAYDFIKFQSLSSVLNGHHLSYFQFVWAQKKINYMLG